MDPTEQPQPSSSSNWPVLIASIVFLLIAAAVSLFFLRSSATSSPPACVNTLRMIDGAKEQWALENKKTAGSPVAAADISEINKYLIGGLPPPCPNGGTYSYNPIGSMPTCTIPGHSI